MSSDNSKLFSSIKYYTTGFRDSSIESQFKQNGATRLFYLTEKTTHVICDDFASHKDELEQDIEIYQIPIVTSDWILACLKAHTLLPIDSYLSSKQTINQEKEQDNTRQLFQSCTFANANLTRNDHNKLYAMVTYYGGRWLANFDSLICTHVICASALPKNRKSGDANNNLEDGDERLQDAYDIQSDKVHLITPNWIIDCIQNNDLIDESNYHPDLLDNVDDSMETDDDDDSERYLSRKVRFLKRNYIFIYLFVFIGYNSNEIISFETFIDVKIYFNIK